VLKPTNHNAEQRIAGSTDVPLCDAGREQVRRLKAALDGLQLDTAVVSPQRRAAETARILVTGRGLPVTFTRDLAERDFGAWEGKSFAQIIAEQPDGGASIMHGPFVARFLHGESDESFLSRVRRAFFEKIIARHRHADVLVVSHAGVLMMMLAIALDLDPATDFAAFRLDNASLTQLDWYDGVPHLGYVNRIV
jgi:broad specificity phosphatase PhoE